MSPFQEYRLRRSQEQEEATTADELSNYFAFPQKCPSSIQKKDTVYMSNSMNTFSSRAISLATQI